MPIVQTFGPSNDQNSLEEIRSAIYWLLGQYKPGQGGQYVSLRDSLAAHFEKQRSNQPALQYNNYGRVELSPHDADLYLEVFWGLFREGIITIGLDDNNPNFPFYRITEYGRKILANQHTYFFTDVSDYERLVNAAIPTIDVVTMLYVKEAVQTFKIGAVLASSVMIGVASEHTFNLVVDTVEGNPTWHPKFAKVFKETRILPRLNEFKKVLDANISSLTPQIKEDLDTHFVGIISLIRTFRNEAGHPTGKIIDREQAYVNLQLFIPYAKKLYQLKDFFT